MALATKLESMARQRLFAVVHIFGRQRLITTGDLLMVDSHLPVKCGQKILLNKCMILGSKDFSIIGRPVVDKNIFKIEATIVERTMSDPTVYYRHKPRNHGIKKLLFQTKPRTVMRINNIELRELPDIDKEAYVVD